MNKYDNQLSENAELLSRYLYQYKNCIKTKRLLEIRKKEIISEFDHPLPGINYDGMPHGSGECLGSASISIRLDAIDTKISEQINKSAKALTDIMDIIDFLPDNSMERTIIEYKYIDRYSWEKICRMEHISRTPATKYWRKGLYELLEFKKVQVILHEYEKQLEEKVC